MNCRFFYFPFENSKNEVDFVIQNEEDKIIPIEVKVGDSLRAKSFKLFCEKYKPETAIRTSLSDFRRESWMTNAPLYMIDGFLSVNLQPLR